mmetsp:Transcript_912/g.2593  ORF Transcript_912/g.2593 Transcript_912/m.2593 type:complete len:228 (-) Transcript_912:774-1457(-)
MSKPYAANNTTTHDNGCRRMLICNWHNQLQEAAGDGDCDSCCCASWLPCGLNGISGVGEGSGLGGPGMKCPESSVGAACCAVGGPWMVPSADVGGPPPVPLFPGGPGGSGAVGDCALTVGVMTLPPLAIGAGLGCGTAAVGVFGTAAVGVFGTTAVGVFGTTAVGVFGTTAVGVFGTTAVGAFFTGALGVSGNVGVFGKDAVGAFGRPPPAPPPPTLGDTGILAVGA